ERRATYVWRRRSWTGRRERRAVREKRLRSMDVNIYVHRSIYQRASSRFSVLSKQVFTTEGTGNTGRTEGAWKSEARRSVECVARTPCGDAGDVDVGVLRLRLAIRFADDVAPLRMTFFGERGTS